jgi:hypothetical protein
MTIISGTATTSRQYTKRKNIYNRRWTGLVRKLHRNIFGLVGLAVIIYNTGRHSSLFHRNTQAPLAPARYSPWESTSWWNIWLTVSSVSVSIYLREFANSSKTRPNADSTIVDEVHMTSDIVHDHCRSDHVFTSGVNVRQAHAKPAMAWVSTLQSKPRSDKPTLLLSG